MMGDRRSIVSGDLRAILEHQLDADLVVELPKQSIAAEPRFVNCLGKRSRIWSFSAQ
jgi:hypothetical protein